MPIIISRELEKDRLSDQLTKDDVLAICEPIETGKMEGYTISKAITDRKLENKNIPELNRRVEYPELALLDA